MGGVNLTHAFRLLHKFATICCRYSSFIDLYKPAKPSMPNPKGPLSASVPSSAIAAANKEVTKVLEEARLDQKDALLKSAHGEYEHYTLKQKGRVGKRVAEHGVTAVIHYLSKVFPDHFLTESTVRTWKKYLQEI